MYQVFSAYVATTRYPYIIGNVKKIVHTKLNAINDNVSVLMSNRGFGGSASLFNSAASPNIQTVRVHNLEQGEMLFNIAKNLKKYLIYLKWKVKKPNNTQFLKVILLLKLFYITFQ